MRLYGRQNPAPHSTGWRSRAACAAPNIDPEIFFPRAERAVADRAEAKAICFDCPVRFDCLEAALEAEAGSPFAAYGVFGGLDAEERRRIIRQRTRVPARGRHAREAVGV